MDDGPVVIICVCNPSRHRSVANKECLHELFHDRRYNNQQGKIHMIDLQAQKQWKGLRGKNFPDCNIQDPKNKQAVKKVKELLKRRCPISTKHEKNGRTRSKGSRAPTKTSEHNISEAASNEAADTSDTANFTSSTAGSTIFTTKDPSKCRLDVCSRSIGVCLSSVFQ